MASSAINGFPIQVSSVTNASFFGFDSWDGSEFQTAKILGSDLKTIFNQNFLSSNLVNTTGAKSHDFGEYDMLWGKIKTFRAEATIAPTSPHASFNFRAFGSSGPAHILSSQSGKIFETNSDHTSKFYGDNDIDGIKKRIFGGDDDVYIRMSPAARGVEISAAGAGSGVNATWTHGFNAGELFAVGGLGGNSICLFSSAINNVVLYSDLPGNNVWRHGKWASEFGLRGNLTGSFVDTQIYEVLQSTGVEHRYKPILMDDGIGGAISNDALLEIRSTSKGFLPSRMTEAQMMAISSPEVGLIVYVTDGPEGLYINKSGGWTLIA